MLRCKEDTGYSNINGKIMSNEEIQQQMDAMRALDEPMPQVGILWYDRILNLSMTSTGTSDVVSQGICR